MKTLISWLKLNSLVLLAVLGLLVVASACVYAMAAVYGWWIVVFIVLCALSAFILFDK